MSTPYRRIPFIFNYSTLFLLALAFMIARCKKEDDHVKTSERMLSVSFSGACIPFNMVDSATAYFTKGSQTFSKKMMRGQSDLSVSLVGLQEGEWSVKIYVYSRIENDNYPRRYDLIKTFGTANTMEGIRIAAPNGQLDDEWKTRVILAETDRSIEIIASIDPTDPYTDITTKGTGWEYIYVDRTTVIKTPDDQGYSDGEAWQCTSNCFLNGTLQFDPNTFVGYSQRLAGKDWRRSEIYASFVESTSGKERTFYYLYNRPQ